MDCFIHPLAGKIRINKSLRAKRISVTVRSTEIILTIPKKTRTDVALGFLESKIDWIISAKRKYSDKFLILPPFNTRLHTLNIFSSPVGQEHYLVAQGGINIFISAEPYSDDSQEIIKNGVDDAYFIEAKLLLPERVNYLALKHGFEYNNLTFRRSYTRWGSCSVKNNISLSSRLMKLPDHLIDYVILHELCHTVHKNHGSQFYKLLDQVCTGNHKKLNSELRGYTTR
ncbi:MAG: M48 family metallopeptidase [Rikenellaceae bacterium]|nr:M48 family metallopeptidase [Rikenellaceae bacterium]